MSSIMKSNLSSLLLSGALILLLGTIAMVSWEMFVEVDVLTSIDPIKPSPVQIAAQP